MRFHILVFSVLAAVPLVLWGCGPGTPPPSPPEPPEQLVAEWKAVAQAGKDQWDIPKAAEIAQKLAAQGPEKLNPLLDLLANAGGNEEDKVLVVMSVMPAISQAHEQKLIELTGAQYDPYTRADAAHLLGALLQRRLATEKGLSRMNELIADPDVHVRNASILVMELAGDPTAVAKAVELWANPETTPNERTSIVLNMPQRAVLSNTKLYAEAVLDTKLSEDARRRAIQDLGMIGDATVLDALKKCAETETNPALKDMAQAAAEAVEARVKQGLVAVPVDTTALPPPPPDAAAPQTAPAPAPSAGS